MHTIGCRLDFALRFATVSLGSENDNYGRQHVANKCVSFTVIARLRANNNYSNYKINQSINVCRQSFARSSQFLSRSPLLSGIDVIGRCISVDTVATGQSDRMIRAMIAI